MNRILLSLFCTFIFSLLSCHPKRKLYQLYKMEDFDIESGKSFIDKIQHLPVIYEISIIDTKANGNDIVVNRQWIFLDTTQTNRPNYYSYRKRADELNISPDSLLNCLNTFYRIGVNEFNRDSNYFRFPVITGFTTNKGYLYSEKSNIQLYDTLPATSVRNKDYHFKVVLVRKVDTNWFEYFEIK